MKLQTAALIAVMTAALTPVGARGQTIVNWQGGATNNNWTNSANWSSSALPTGAFDEIASVANGGTVVINSNLNNVTPPDGPPGGLTVGNNSKIDVVGAGHFDVNATGPNVQGTASFTGGATLAITGSAASFSSKGLDFGGGGVYTPVITGASHGLISVAGPLALNGGTLRPSFSSFTPSVPQSWILADATSIAGNFALNASAAGLTFGKRLETAVIPGGTNGQQLRLDLKAVLGLTVNADTGATSISSPTGAAITMTAYGLASPGGYLKPAGWSTLTSQLGGGWNVAGTPSAAQLNELGGPVPPSNTTQASLTLNATARSLGTAFNFASLPFGTSPTAQFQYVTSAGAVVNGDVQFTGLKGVNNLLLTVDPVTGQAQLSNSSQTTISLRGYTIQSTSGALKPATGSWNSLHDQGLAGVDEANASANNLSELIPLVANSLTLAPGQTYSLGSLFTTTGSRDLQLSFLYTTPLAGDFDGNGSVNSADLVAWKAQYGTTRNGSDFLAWQRNLGATNSAATPSVGQGVVRYQTLAATAALGAVPEPTSLGATLVAVLALAAIRGARKSRVAFVAA